MFIAPQPFFEWRGSPIRISFNLRALAEAGYAVDLLTFPVGQAWDCPGVTVHRIPPVPGVRDVPIGPSPRKAFLDVLLLLKGLALVRRIRYDVIHGVEEAGAIAALLAPVRGSRLIFEKHSDPASYRRGWLRNLVLWCYARVEHWTAARADAVITTGPGLAAQIRGNGHGVPVHDIFDIPSSLVEARAEEVARVRRTLAPHADDLVILYVGSFAVYQGVELMFKSVPAVAAAYPRARFVVIGGTPEQVSARRAALPGPAAEAVTFLDPIAPDVLPNYLAAADILLSPRLSGVNTPLKLLDYLKAGRAILATNTPANRLILDETNAVLVAPEAMAFAQGIGRLIADAGLRERLGHEARLQVDRTYNFAGFKARLSACYAALGPVASAVKERG